MTFTEYAKVKNVLTVDTKWGKRKVCNVTTDRGDEAIWANDLSAFSNIKAGQTINVIRGAKGSLTILENTPSMSEVSNGSNEIIKMNRPSSQQEGSYYTYSNNGNTILEQTYSQRNGNGHSRPDNPLEDILDLPVLSDADKRNMMDYVRSQARLLKFCFNEVCREFPELAQTDPRGARSLAVTLLISANTARDKY